jgi:hypothetical protein
VTRNKQWFADNIGQLEKVWRTIEHERITGYEHRAPKRKTANAAGVNTAANAKASPSALMMQAWLHGNTPSTNERKCHIDVDNLE